MIRSGYTRGAHLFLVVAISRVRVEAHPEAIVCISVACPLKGIKKTYGEKSPKAVLAFKALDASLAEAFDAMSAGAGRRLTSQLVVGPTLAERLAIGGRRLGTYR